MFKKIIYMVLSICFLLSINLIAQSGPIIITYCPDGDMYTCYEETTKDGLKMVIPKGSGQVVTIDQ